MPRPAYFIPQRTKMDRRFHNRSRTYKACRQCSVVKPISEFYLETRTGTPKTDCKVCFNETRKSDDDYIKYKVSYREKNKVLLREKTKKWRDRKRCKDSLGFSMWQWLSTSRNAAKRLGHVPCTATVEELKASYTTICQCCLKDSKRMLIDHCHKTGKFRGWVCNWCNLLLGHARDSREVLLAAVSYLDRVKV